MYFKHAGEIWREFPELVPGVIHVRGITAEVTVDDRLAPYHAVADSRLAAETVGGLPEIQAWRGAFSRMGLKPTQYRSASESLLRRYSKDGSLPRIHPLIDVCNAISLAFATPIAVFDLSAVTGFIDVRHAAGDETYRTFGGEVEHPAENEVIFVDANREVHARRWCNRQSGSSAVRESTADVLIVAEAMHDGASADVERLIEAIAGELRATWQTGPQTAILTSSEPQFAF